MLMFLNVIKNTKSQAKNSRMSPSYVIVVIDDADFKNTLIFTIGEIDITP